MEDTGYFVCECNSFVCDERVLISPENYLKLGKRRYIIADKCPARPRPGDPLVEQREGYKVYSLDRLFTVTEVSRVDEEYERWLEEEQVG